MGLRVAIAATVIAAATLGGVARAETPLEVRVNVRDLDPSTPAGAQTLLRRIRYAAELVCGDPYVYDLADRAQRFRCRAEAIDRAVREADIPLLTAFAHPSEPVRLAGG
jgi:UrcA family protein